MSGRLMRGLRSVILAAPVRFSSKAYVGPGDMVKEGQL